MNADDQRLPDFVQQAAELDPLANVPIELLLDIVEERGTCWWEVTNEDPPDIAAPMPDRALAARMCAGCPVQRECLELELRTEGSATAGVWGALCEVDRRACTRRGSGDAPVCSALRTRAGTTWREVRGDERVDGDR